MKPIRSINSFLNRTIQLRTLAVLLFTCLVILALAIWLRWDFVWEQFRAFALGHAELAAENYGAGLQNSVDRVEIHEVSSAESATNTHETKINGSKTLLHTQAPILLTGDAADAFMQHWSDMQFHWGLSALCHEPGFIIHFSRNNRTVLKTSVCLKCQNFTVPSILGDSFMGFNSKNPKGLAFVEHLKSLFPSSEKWRAAKPEDTIPGTITP